MAEIEARRIDITAGDEKWFKIGCALANTFGENGRDLFHRVSQFYPTYCENEANKKYNHCLKKNYSYNLGSFFHYCKQAGIAPCVSFAPERRIGQTAEHPDLQKKKNTQAEIEQVSAIINHPTRLNSDDLQRFEPMPAIAANAAPEPMVQGNQTSFDRLKEKYPAIAVLAEKLELEVVETVQKKC